MQSKISWVLPLALCVMLAGCSKRPDRIRVYVVDYKAHDSKLKKRALAAKKKRLARKNPNYEAPGRLRESGAQIYRFKIPRGLKAPAEKSGYIVLKARLPMNDVAKFFKRFPKDYVVVDSGRGFKVMQRNHLKSDSLDSYVGPRLYGATDSKGNVTLSFFRGTTGVKSKTIPNPTKSPTKSPGATVKTVTVPTPSRTTTTARPATKSSIGKPDIPIAPSRIGKLQTGKVTTYVPPVSPPKALDRSRLPASVRQKILEWERKHPGKTFEM